MILVVTGPPGAGKSTVARVVAATFERGAHLQADSFWSFIASGLVPPWLPEAHAQNTVVGDATFAAAVELARGGYTVVFDGVVFPWSLERLVDRAWQAHVDVEYVIIRPDRNTCLARGTARADHELVDPGPIGQMYDQFVDIGWYERFVIDTTNDTPEQTAHRIVERERQAVIEVVGPPETDLLVLAEPDPTWPEWFEKERAEIAAALGDVRIEHVGSTSVPGLPAKAILDIQVSVPNIDDHEAFVPALERAGYVLRVREPGHVLVRSLDRRVHVHVCRVGSEWERRHLVFRDWLRSHPGDRDLYADVKRRLLRDEWESMIDYSYAKTGVITTIMQRAEAATS